MLSKTSEFSKNRFQELSFHNIQPRTHVAYLEGINKEDNIDSYFTNKDGNNAVQELFVFQDFIVILTVHGVCTAFNRLTRQCQIINRNNKEKIRSIFMNDLNDSIFIVSVKEKFDCSRMKCRSLPVSELQKGDNKGTKLFTKFVLKWPDFIEFDELNSKIVTKHSEEGAYRVWSLQTYEMLYVLTHEFLAEFKICNGVMLLLFNPVGNSIPMIIMNVHTGEPMMNIAYQGQLSEIEFVEQFNECILIKQKDKPLKIHDILTNQSQLINNFESPDAFIFVYEKELFVSLREGKITIWSTDGSIITDFNQKILYTQEPDRRKIQDRNYVISLSTSRKYLFTVIKQEQLPNLPVNQNQNNQIENPENLIQQQQLVLQTQNLTASNNRVTTPIQASLRQQSNSQQSQKSTDVIISVIDIQKGRLVSEIRVETGKKNSLKLNPKKMEKLMNIVTYVFYDEIRHEIITGHESGSIVLWN
eukprot:403355201